jgi:hypothetical protein
MFLASRLKLYKGENMYRFRILGLLFIVTITNLSADLSKKFTMTNPTSASLMNQQIMVAPGIKMEVGDYVLRSNFKAQPKLELYFDKSFENEFLKAPVEYTETVEARNDRIIITRRLLVDPKDPCDPRMLQMRGRSNTAAISLCFEKNNKVMPANIKRGFSKEMTQIRTKIKDSTTIDSREKTLLLSMSDEELTNYMLNQNGEQKEIVHESVMPLVVYKKLPSTPLDVMEPNFVLPTFNQYSATELHPTQIYTSTNANATLSQQQNIVAVKEPAGKVATNKKPKTQSFAEYQASQYGAYKIGDVVAADPIDMGADATQSKTYKFLLGDTLGKHYGDSYRVRFAKARWWHDEYYAKFTYSFGYQFGLRWPFEVDVSSTITKGADGDNTIRAYPSESFVSLCPGVTNALECATNANIRLSARGVDGNADFYRMVGLNEAEVANGKELLFNLEAYAKLYVSIPGPNINYRKDFVPGFNLDNDFASPLGNENAELYKKVFKGEDLGLVINVWGMAASLDLGAKIIATNGKMKVDVNNYWQTAEDNNAFPGFVEFGSKNDVLAFQLNTNNIYVESRGPNGTKSVPWGITLSNPKYTTKFKIIPLVGIGIGIDVCGYGWMLHLPEQELTALAIDMGTYSFHRHQGTANSYEYIVAQRNRNHK